jgi:phosphatidylglycerophosphatase A
MKCPKCQYIGFEQGNRCRNCGYDFSLSNDLAELDLPIKTGDEALGPLADFDLVDERGAVAAEQAFAGQSDPMPAVRASELPLFGDRLLDDDRPLVSLPATPRAPVSVRKSAPVRHAERERVAEPVLDLEPSPAVTSGSRRRHTRLTDDPVAEPEPTDDAAAPAGARLLGAVVDLLLLAAIDVTVVYLTLRLCDLNLAQLRQVPVVPLAAFLAGVSGNAERRIHGSVHGGRGAEHRENGCRDSRRLRRRKRSHRRSPAGPVRRAGGGIRGVGAARRPRVPARTVWSGSPGAARPSRANARRQGVTRLAVFIATVGYCGYFPFAPGTVGSAAGLAFYALVWWTASPLLEVSLIVALFALGVWAGTTAERYFGGVDPGPIVLDEVVGMLITLAFIPGLGWSGALAGFVLFRIADIVKPFPAGRFEQLHGGLGVMADDAMAAVYANIALRFLLWLMPGWIA